MLNSEYKLSESSVQSQQPKSYQKQPSNHGIYCPILILVPPETLTAITSYLEPPSLSALAVVNIYLNEHVKDDNTWRRAFFYQFLGIGPENDLDDNKALLLRRLERSWRNEFTVRYKLKRRWERSRNTVTTHIPFGSPISAMHVMPSHAMLTSSVQFGTVARSLPLTGRILPGYLNPSEGAGIDDAEFIHDISTCAISSDGGTAKIVWGTRAGDVLFMNAPRVMDNGRRDTAVQRCDIVDKHGGSVLDVEWAVIAQSAALAWAAVTASADGRVKLWDAKTGVCLWTSQRKSNTVVPDPCLKVTARDGCIAAVMKSGDIHIWTGFSLGCIATYDETSITETILECPISTSTQGYDPQATHAVMALHIDPNTINILPILLVAYENDPFFYRIRVGSETRTGAETGPDVDITTFGDPFFGSTSIIEPYFRSPTAEQQASFVLVGDHLGWVSLYAWDSLNLNPITSTIEPVRKFEAHPDSTSITALTWSPHTLVTGSARGTTRVFDALSFRHLRSFASPIPKARGRHQVGDALAERSRQKVKQIIVGTGAGGAASNLSSSANLSSSGKVFSTEDRDLVFICAGDRVMAWKAGPVPKHLHGGVRARHTHGALGKKKRVGYVKYLQQLEVNQTILESQRDHQLLLEESRYKKANSFEYAQQRERLKNLGLSEVEAVEYVLMLSRDEANANGNNARQLEEVQGVFHGDFDTEHIMDHDEGDDDACPSLFTVSGSKRSSTTMPLARSSSHSSLSSSSPSLSSCSSDSNLTALTRKLLSVPRPISSSSNDKIQVSPPFRAEPMEAGEEWLVDYNIVRSGSAPSSRDTNTSMGPEMEAHIFPPIVSGGIRNQAQGPKREDGEKRNVSEWKKKKDNGENMRHDKPQGTDKAPAADIPSPSARYLASTSARNIPYPPGQSNISSPSSPSTSASAPKNAWTSGGPSLSARISLPAAAATSSRHYQGGGRDVDSNMDEDLRFAIELSLVEARSSEDV